MDEREINTGGGVFIGVSTINSVSVEELSPEDQAAFERIRQSVQEIVATARKAADSVQEESTTVDELPCVGGRIVRGDLTITNGDFVGGNRVTIIARKPASAE